MKIEPRWWQKEVGPDGLTDVYHCGLCFHECRIPVGRVGLCGARGAGEDGFVSPYLGYFSSSAVDPIEKKPLHHWRPGNRIFSLGSAGCNMRCPFCQNHDIARPSVPLTLTALTPEELTAKVKSLDLDSVAFTYNEPALQAEYIMAAAPLMREQGIATVLVTNGMFSPKALRDLTPLIDAANVDLKTFNPLAYTELGGSLEAVKNTIVYFLKDGVHLELTTLVVPDISDEVDEFAALVDWVADLSPDVPLHISRYFPAAGYKAPATDLNLLNRFRDLASAKLHYVHLGNVG